MRPEWRPIETDHRHHDIGRRSNRHHAIHYHRSKIVRLAPMFGTGFSIFWFHQLCCNESPSSIKPSQSWSWRSHDSGFGEHAISTSKMVAVERSLRSMSGTYSMTGVGSCVNRTTSACRLRGIITNRIFTAITVARTGCLAVLA